MATYGCCSPPQAFGIPEKGGVVPFPLDSAPKGEGHIAIVVFFPMLSTQELHKGRVDASISPSLWSICNSGWF